MYFSIQTEMHIEEHRMGWVKHVCCSLSGQRVDDLEEALKKKDEDMKQMEERYKKYLEKAKSVSIFVLS